MPAIGFAILINVIGKRSILPFFFIGFFIVKIFGCSALQLACLGIAFSDNYRADDYIKYTIPYVCQCKRRICPYINIFYSELFLDI